MSARPEPARWRFADRYRGRRVLVVGLGASGSSALRWLLGEGADVVVTDSRAAPPGIEALRAAHPQVRFHVGAFAMPHDGCDLAVVSPGVDLREPLIAALRQAGVPVIGDVELFAGVANAPVVGITGSNGKSTVTSLVGEMAAAAGLRVAVGGNLGTPALDLLGDDVQLYVLELSSFQLETTASLRLAAAAWLNLSEDHLDRHGTLDAYAAAKARIFAHCGTAVVNADDDATRRGSGRAARVVAFTIADRMDADYRLARGADGRLRLETPLDLQAGAPETAALPLSGRHNLANALAALALADALSIDARASRGALARFGGLPHRCRLVREHRGVRWIDDSKGTNVGATLAALQGYDAPIVWLGGGQGKGQDFSPLVAPLAAKGRAALVYGADAALLADVLHGHLPVQRHATLDDSVQAASRLVQAGDTVLLSPACASLDQFRNYVARGERFAALVEALA